MISLDFKKNKEDRPIKIIQAPELFLSGKRRVVDEGEVYRRSADASRLHSPRPKALVKNK